MAALRAVVVGVAILIVGGGVAGAMLFANLKVAPSIPVFLPATAIWLWLFWRYLNGAGWPPASAESRRAALRARALSAPEWAWAMVAGGLALTAVMGIAFVTYRFAALPEGAHQPPLDLAGLPPLTLVSMFASLALTAAVVEEAAFRGYMLSGIQARHGWAAGIAVVTILFYLAHSSHAYATASFLPFFLAHGLVFGLLVYFTRSILPGVILHAVSDFIVLPMQYGVLPSAGHWDFVAHGWLSLVTGVAAVVGFRRLAREVATSSRRLS